MSDDIIVSLVDSFCTEEVASDERVYIKRERVDNELVWAIYSPEGERMAHAFSREMALALIRQNNLSASQVH